MRTSLLVALLGCYAGYAAREEEEAKQVNDAMRQSPEAPRRPDRSLLASPGFFFAVSLIFNFFGECSVAWDETNSKCSASGYF